MLDEPGSIHILILIFLLILSGFFSGAEVALVSLSPAKSRSLLNLKKRGAKAVEYLKQHADRLLITILIGNNLANVSASILAERIFSNIFGDFVGITIAVLTLAILIFGEITPKTLAQRNAEAFSLLSAPIILWMGRVLFPLVWILERFLHLMSPKHQEFKHFSDEELLALAEIGEEEGTLDTGERERIEGVLEFGETTVAEVMTPRVEMDVLPDTVTLQEAVNFFLEKTHTRIPIFHDTIDNIVGIISLKDVLQFDQNFASSTPLLDLLTKSPLVLRVPVSMMLEGLLKEMKWKRKHMAIVIDEHGGTAGLVTMEDLLEEVFGEIRDETDEEEEEIKKIEKNDYLVLGSAEVEDIREKTGFEIPGEESDRIAKIILDILGKFPKRGEEVDLKNDIIAVVEKMEGHKIKSLRIRKRIKGQV